MTVLDRLPLTRIALGIRFDNQFGIEDVLGEIIDDVISDDHFGPTRFDQTTLGPTGRTLVNSTDDETITFTRCDAIFDTKSKKFSIDHVPDITTDFIDVVWRAVCSRAPRIPSINRYGCLIGFELPETWNTIRSVLGAEAADTSELDIRYLRRLIAEEGLALADVKDYRTA